MAVRSDKIGIVFHTVHYNINDIERVWYNSNEKKITIKLYNNSEKYDIEMSEERAKKYINEINSYRFDKIIRFDDTTH